MSLQGIFRDKKILVCAGSGGVGKTSLAAAIALEAATRGKKVIVLTIDPAKRLATALGLSQLSSDPVEIDLGTIANEGRSPSEMSDAIPGDQMGGTGRRAVSPPAAKRRPSGDGRLFAMMLDTKRTFDRLIERHTPDPRRREAILNNRLYQHMSNMIAGSQEYMAMEKLHELYHDEEYDLLVLDTPPTRHALDFLEAPSKMANITGSSLLEWFLKPGIFVGRQAGRLGLGILQKGAEKILAVFDRLAGFSFLYELSEMVSLLSNLLGGFHERARAVYDLLHQDFVGFLLVTSPSSVAIQDALYFHQKIAEEKLPFIGFIINRIHEACPAGPEDLPSEFSPSLRTKLLENLRNIEQLALRDQRTVTLLKKMGGKGIVHATIPLLESDVHDLDGLRQMNKALFRAC